MTAKSSKRAATLSDVSERAGVSLATASKALNGRSDVAARTRERVLQAAEEVGFTPNAVARGLTAGRTGTVGLLTSDLDGRFMIPILMGAEDALGAGKIDVFLCDARGDSVREQHHLRALLSRRVDGIIVVGDTTNPRTSLGHELPVPVVYAYAPSDDARDLSLTPDNVAGGRQAIEHLLACGRTRIAHIGGDPSYAATRDRIVGAEQALAAAGLELVAPPMLSEWSERWGRSAAALLFERHPEVDAVFCGSDQVARGVLDTARDVGRRVPEDVAVMGYDNWSLLAENARPELSSVDAGLQTLGRAAAQFIFDALDDRDAAPGVHRLPVSTVIRGSTVAFR
ncbi:LacI family DNA-binding transcriptional regulator [Microbacterium halophytorum]|uniref:LacI family DNA-binding transcriptional regulator n=1 Tax=Microbacterium halophytorum TaxID=2067568 RepID=UPI000CFB775B|nr:LacI family DNA-binding transcriptional regulator [Microbacterium halophytorum]